MLTHVRQKVFAKLWDNYSKQIPYYNQMFGDKLTTLDHLAIIDIPSDSSGIPHLKKLMGMLNMQQRGAGYLPDKVNDFIWMAADDIERSSAREALLQPVLADFRIDELSSSSRKIINKYINKREFDYATLARLISEGDSAEKAAQVVVEELSCRPWGLPTTNDYLAIKEENQLIAWVLLNGRKINHFGVCVHFDSDYKNLAEFNSKISNSNFAKMNNFAGLIKGDKDCGIEQSSTLGKEIKIKTADGEVTACDTFMEFVWRHPVKEDPYLWGDYFTGFIPKNANNVIKSIYN